MSKQLLKEVRKVLSGKHGPLDDEELEFLAKKISTLGFKLGFARAYAAGPHLMERLIEELENRDMESEKIHDVLK
ncbi:MAG: hypothetical protein GXP22_11265 [Gammaproteobacteria bacterium]|nr:hypothetical protein [Gammaproteobacteria bacterium]